MIDLTQQWTVIYGALAVLISVGSISVALAVYYFKRMEAHFKMLHEMVTNVTVLTLRIDQHTKQLVDINIELEELKDKGKDKE